ncbi:MAG: very short patch repair endonuclease [Candidatus Saccharibacteria bacterium]|nr:MAG: very short patch repair endonuclease [Candidatus Saccharibacteria bacterium]
MADVFEPEKRCEIMRLVKSKNSKVELRVFRYLRRRGVYFQKHYKRASGTPDIALPRKKLAVFIDGDFWHGRTFEVLKQAHPDPDDYWVRKMCTNMERDARQEVTLLVVVGKFFGHGSLTLIVKNTAWASLRKIELLLVQDRF